jgi:MFS family permease
MAGYAGGFVGPIMVGWILDLAGGMSPWGWSLAFLHIAGVVLIGRLAFVYLAPRDLVGDKAGR